MTPEQRRLDAYATPRELADLMVAAIPRERVDVIADPAAGNGALLAAAARRWPAATLVGADVAASASPEMTRERPWPIVRADLLDPEARGRLSSVVGSSPRRSVLLNPPFSYRGGRHWHVAVEDMKFRVTRAMAFLLSSLELVGPEGALVALVPAGLLHSARDAAAREHLGRTGEFTRLRANSPWSFPGAVTATALVRWVPRRANETTARQVPPSVSSPGPGPPLGVVRGTRPMHLAYPPSRRGTTRLVHTSALRNGALIRELPRVALGPRERVTTAPAVLLPRVGQPTRTKVVAVTSGTFLLSDCVYALMCESPDEAHDVAADLRGRFETSVAPAYGGTGAPYLLRDSLVELLRSIGYDAKARSSRSLG